MHKVGRTIAEGIALVFLVLIMFLGSPRSALVVAVSIPLALVSVFSLLNLTKVSANLLSLGAIDFGILVDGAIVVTEAILRRREAMPDEELSESEVKAAALQVTRPIFFASLIIITAYLPLFSFQRAEAELFTPMAYTMGYALFGALLTSAGPGARARLLSRSANPGTVYHNRWLERLTERYERVLAACLREPRIIYGVAVFALLAVIGLGATVGRDFLPDLDEGALWLQVQMPTGCRSGQGERHGERPAPRDPQVPGSLLRRHANRAQRRRHRSLDHVAHRGSGRSQALRHLAGRRDQEAVLDKLASRARPGSARLLDRHQPADHRRRQRHDRRRAQPAGDQDLWR